METFHKQRKILQVKDFTSDNKSADTQFLTLKQPQM